MKKILFIAISIIVLTPLLAQARMSAIYPIYGYNSVDHICQVKQISETSEVRQELDGEYWNLRECRSGNSEILFYTGFGIILWALLFALILLKNFYILPRYQLKKLNTLEKKVDVLWESFLICSSIFFLILLLHYFNVPQAVYSYTSDIDHIIYSVLIDRKIAFVYVVVYILVSSVALVRKRSSRK